MKFLKHTWFTNFILDLFGCFSIAIAIHIFLTPAQIAPGGISGLGIILNYLFNLPIGLAVLLFNLPLLFFAWKVWGRTFTLLTFRTILLSTIILDTIVTPYLTPFYGDRLLSSLFGGLLSGIGLGVIFAHGSTTGGTDILCCLLKRRFPFLPAGQALLIIDAVILVISMIVYDNIESGLFGTIALYVQMKAMDGILYGMDQAIVVLIMSSKSMEISQTIIQKMSRSATLLYSMGAYHKKNSLTLLCIIRKPELSSLKTVILESDPTAFVTIAPANQVLGEGFRDIQKDL